MRSSSVLVGTYTTGSASQGIYRLEAGGGAALAVPARDPSYLLATARGLYWVEEALGEAEGRLCFAPARGASVAPLSTGGENPCHLAASPDGRWLAVANYTSGSVVLYRTNRAGRPAPAGVFPGLGRGPNDARQEGPHAHFVVFATDGELWCCDLGCDIIRRLTLGDGGWREGPPRFRLPAGCGPRHMAIREGRAYVLCELSSMLYTLRADSGELLSATRCAPESAGGTAAAIRLGADGRLYTSHRGGDLVGVFSLNDADRPERVAAFPCGGRTPRDILPVGDLLYCACQDSDCVTIFSTDAKNPYRQLGKVAVPRPVCLAVEGG